VCAQYPRHRDVFDAYGFANEVRAREAELENPDSELFKESGGAPEVDTLSGAKKPSRPCEGEFLNWVGKCF
jgi:hypothetical protein